MPFASPTLPRKRVASPTLFLCWGVAGLLALMAVAQLMTMDTFVPTMQNYQLPDASAAGKVIAGLLTIGEVVALPFLLRMNMSWLMRGLSLLALNLTALSWVGLGIWVFTTHPPLIGTGIVGGLLSSLSGMVVLPFGIALLALSLLSSWSLRNDLKR